MRKVTRGSVRLLVSGAFSRVTMWANLELDVADVDLGDRYNTQFSKKWDSTRGAYVVEMPIRVPVPVNERLVAFTFDITVLRTYHRRRRTFIFCFRAVSPRHLPFRRSTACGAGAPRQIYMFLFFCFSPPPPQKSE